MAVGFLLVTTEPGREEEVRARISELPACTGTWICFGAFDLFVKLEDEEDELTRCIVQDIRQQLDGIRDTTTLIGAEI
ncbi:MAG: Lrp/AsnC family transcriptional regulator [Candidatus Thermoplasmatota archaeon]|uniref:Transcription regulator AsnC/Lrp ligand binding domain-containing protein n=1 Tax=marine metagenome TaxID=408172 RepID=A0A381UTE1_9ZZZZ|nr:AsnC family transcriptional regulator [Euryarchaeota archaeon]MEC7700288.1 Lrp/AsnC family transcriptional regulator [Candidatus Thermoplasmatota archaeon]|tara:strand:+ start:1610 stop:1843 length:234 start_codon:yes stop_codon:yes gene_type:complete